jgi:serine/threonine protein kinase
MNKSKRNVKKSIRKNTMKNTMKNIKKNVRKNTMKNIRKNAIKKNTMKNIRKNAIKKKYRNKKRIGGVKIYTQEGEFITNPEILHEGKEFFRKKTNNQSELELCKLLMMNPHKNIVKIYDVGADYIDMELVDTDSVLELDDASDVIQAMQEAKDFLQGLGIMYIDWKLDNTGKGEDGQYKLFDFDASGLINKETNEWILEPPKYWSYNEATKKDKKNPIDIDNYAFEIGFQ